MYTLTQASLQEREGQAHQKERGEVVLGFYTILFEFYNEEVLQGFIPCGFPEENICVLCVIVLVVIPPLGNVTDVIGHVRVIERINVSLWM